MKDIENKDDIRRFVDDFYTRVRKDDLIGPVFNNRIPEDKWPAHLERLYSFWNTVLFNEADYLGNPFSKHIGMMLTDAHFERWLHLFEQTLQDHFSGARAAYAKERAHIMAKFFITKLNRMKDGGNRSVI